MVWTATIDDFDIVNGRNKITFIFSDGVRQFPEDIFVEPDAVIADIVRDRIAHLEKVSTLHASIKKGPVIPSAPIAINLPDPAVEAKYALQRAISDYNMALQIQSAQPTYDLTKYKQAVVDAEAALQAVSKV